MTAITPAQIRFENGVPRSTAFDDVYHSADGGLDQARTVFLEGNDLPRRWQRQSAFQVLETGFGIGLNFLVTWNAWRNHPAENRSAQLHFVSLEKHPPTRDDLTQALAPFGTLGTLRDALMGAWPPLVAGFHRLEFDDGRVVLTLVLGDIRDTLPQLTMAADAVYLDGFAPARNPDMWEEGVIRHIARQCVPGATLATWSVAGKVRRALEHEGFSVSRMQGFGHKRERLVAHFDRIPPSAFSRRLRSGRNPVLAGRLHGPPTMPGALIIGAGIAGCLMAEALARRGWNVDLLDRHSAPAQEASGNPAGILRPVLSKDDNLASRLGRAAYLHTLRLLNRLQTITGMVEQGRCGVLHLAQDDAHESLQQAVMQRHRYPEDYARFVGPGEASERAGVAVNQGGWFFPGGGWVSPGSLCRAALTAGAEHIRPRWNTSVASLSSDGQWQARDAAGDLLAQAPVVILALGAHAHELPETARLPIARFRGQITLLSEDPFPPGTPVICQEGYLIPGLSSGICIGATYDTDEDPQPRDSSTRENLARLERLLGHGPMETEPLAERVGFRSVAQDRMPLVGPLPQGEHLYCLMGLASRGLVWSSLAAELIAAALNNEPLPLEWDLVQAISPARFVAGKN